MPQPSVDIVIPVHGGLHHTLDCLQSVWRHTAGDYRVIVVDDWSPNGVAEQLEVALTRTWPAQSRLLRNRRNVGFVGSVNHGVAAGSGELVVLLNSDVVVTTGWLEGLTTALRSAEDIGAVTPLSNHANLTRVDIPWGAPPDQIAAAIRMLSPHRYPEIGLASGFCMLTPRSLWEDLKGFDQLFSPGYFEEADYCMRAKVRGFRTIADDGTYVHHHGWGSFGPSERTSLLERNARLFERRWGDAHKQWRATVEQDQPFRDLVERVARTVPTPGGSVVASAFRGAAEAARTRAPEHRRPQRRPAAATALPAVALDGQAPRIGFLLTQVHRDAVTADLLRLADALLLAGAHATVASTGTVDVGVFADPIALRPFLGTERDLLELLPRHDAWLAADPGATDLCRQLGWRDQVSAWQLRIDPRAQDVTWTADPEQPTVRIPMWVDSLAFASRRASATIVVPVPPRPQPDAVELTRRVLADLGPEDVVLHGHVAPSPLEEVAGRATTHVGHLSLADEVDLLARARCVVGTLAGSASHPGVGRALAAGCPVIADPTVAPEPDAVLVPDPGMLDDDRTRRRVTVRGLHWARRHDVRRVARDLASSLTSIGGAAT